MSRESSVGPVTVPLQGLENRSRPLPTSLTVEEKAAELKLGRRDCRKCRAFTRDPSGMSFGWCTAFEQYVKLYHGPREFWSQCQFKVIARTTAPGPVPAAAASG